MKHNLRGETAVFQVNVQVLVIFICVGANLISEKMLLSKKEVVQNQVW